MKTNLNEEGILEVIPETEHDKYLLEYFQQEMTEDTRIFYDFNTEYTNFYNSKTLTLEHRVDNPTRMKGFIVHEK
jgi:hypothetical protein